MNQNKSDEELAGLTIEGDRAAFALLVERYTPLLYSLSFRMLGEYEAVEDAVQDILVKAYQAISSFDPSRRFHTWIYTIGVNYLRSLHRKKRLKRVEGFDPDLLGDENALPEEGAIAKEGERLAQEAIAKLPVKYREVFLLRAVEEISVKESAAILGIPENTVKIRLRRARMRLEAFMRNEGWE